MKYKYFLFSTVICASVNSSSAQGFFNQNGEIIKLYSQQLALLQTYSAALNEGYKIVEGGINLTRDLKNGEFGLHSAYYTSLETVNPEIKKYPFVTETIDLYNKMALTYGNTIKDVNASAFLSGEERQSIQSTYSSLLEAAGEDMNELEQLVTNGELKMSDDERIKRLNDVYKRIRQKYNSVDNIDSRVESVLTGRKQQRQSADLLKKLYGL